MEDTTKNEVIKLDSSGPMVSDKCDQLFAALAQAWKKAHRMPSPKSMRST